MTNAEAKAVADIVMSCAYAVIAGAKTVTISVRGKRPANFPRGELLSIGTDGSKNYAISPLKALEWVHGRTSKAANAEITGRTPAQNEADGA